MRTRLLIAKANKLARELRDNDSPTTGESAVKFWEICSGYQLVGAQTAKKLYLKAGYIPFEGYPLKRKRGA